MSERPNSTANETNEGESFVPYTHGQSLTEFTIKGATPVEDATWGSIKSLYQ